MTKSQTCKLLIITTMIFVSGLSSAEDVGNGETQVDPQAEDINSPTSIVYKRTATPKNKYGLGSGLTGMNPTLEIDKSYLSEPTLDIHRLKYNPQGDGTGIKVDSQKYLNGRLENPGLQLDLTGLPYLYTDFSCNRMPESFELFKDIKDEANVCFANKIPVSERVKYSEEQLLKADAELCKCLSKSTFTSIQDLMKEGRAKSNGFRTNEDIQKDVKENILNMVTKVATLQDGMMFQSHMLFSGDSKLSKKAAINSSTYSGNFINTLFKNGGAAAETIKASGNIMALKAIDASGRGGSPMIPSVFGMNAYKKENNALKPIITKALSQIELKTNSVELLAEPEFAPGQCMGAKEYFSYMQFPMDKQFYGLLRDETTFDPKRWDFKELENRLKVLATEKNRDDKEVTDIKLRLRFLYRNPLMKNLFAADDKYDDYAEAKKLDSATKNRLEKISKTILPAKKQELFEIIKNHVAPKDPACFNKNFACRNNAVKNVANYDGAIKKFFDNPNVSFLTTAQAEKSAMAEVNNLIENPIPPQVLPTSQKELEDQVFKSMHSNGAPHPNDCSLVASLHEGKELDPACVYTYASYCPMLDKVKDQIANKELDVTRISRDLSLETTNMFEPDIEKNLDLKTTNNQLCNFKRKPKDGGPARSFNDFHEEFCQKNKSDKLCANRSYENIMALRKVYGEKYLPAESPAKEGSLSKMIADEVNAIESLLIHREIPNSTRSDAKEIANGDSSPINRGLDEFLKEFNAVGGELPTDNKVEGPGMLANLNTVMKSNDSAAPGIMDSYDGDGLGYSNSQALASNAVVEPPKIENMSDESKEELLGQWKSEFEDWKKANKGKEESASASSAEASMKAKIEALETLLTEQRKLTNDQYKLLNEAIANQRVQALPVQPQVAANNADKEVQERVKARSSSGFTTSSSGSGISDETQRAPASVKEFNTSGSGAGNSSGASASSRKSSSSSGAVSSAADSVAREEAKLVNLRRFSDGSITIETVNRGSQASANAITVPVSDEQYRLLQSNPTALNLSNIEKSIPQDQMARLEKTGQIILVLQNGSNPPFEVKVEKKDNKLVYQLKDNLGNKVNPVQRIYTRQALELQLKTQ
ncbi:MAG: hypothetical protein NDI69_02105 [Bacteriovoracaceae bacterium]|nr:hypothetical protein [Bacteriovoracaceae bacterium]